jgi:hypothetical protein
MRSSGRAATVTGAGFVIQVLCLAAGEAWAWATPLGMLLSGWGLFHYHRLRGHSTRYTLIGTASALLPVLGPVMGLILSPPQPSAPVFSYSNWGWTLLVFALLCSASPSMPASAFTLGCLTAAALAFAAWAARRAGRGTLAGLLFLCSIGGCAAVSAHRMIRSFDEVSPKDLPPGKALDELSGSDYTRYQLLAAKEGAAKGQLSSLRSALKAYADEHKGARPAELTALTDGGRHLAEMPKVRAPGYHDASAAVRKGTTPDDAGGWLYDPAKGEVRVNCTHAGMKGQAWDSY